MHPDDDLRFRLRGLPRELEPPTDAWPGIAARLAPAVAGRSGTRRGAWRTGFALAAAVCVAVGLAWSLRPPTPTPAPATTGVRAEVVRREADALTVEYQAALRQFDGTPVPAPIAPAIATLDRSARDLRGALAADPDAAFLLDQLRHTYARRLALTQRAATG